MVKRGNKLAVSSSDRRDYMKVRDKMKISLVIAFLAIASFGGYSNSFAKTKYTRYYGNDRVLTSIESAKTFSSDVLVIAPAYSYQDAISAMNIVNKFNGRMILVGNGDNIGQFENDKSIKSVYIVGGNEGNRKISSSIDLKLAKNATVNRITGKDIYETNRKTLELTKYKNIGVATGEVYADALSSYGVLREENLGILLVNGKKSYNSSGYNVVYTFGGKNTVVQDGGQRIAGVDRYDTSNKIAQKTAMKNVVFVDGRNYADSMSAVNITNSKKADIVLVPRNKNAQTMNIAKNAGEIFVVGGPKSVEDQYVRQAIDGTPAVNTGGQNSSGNIPINYADGWIRVNMPSALTSDIKYNVMSSVAEEETAITFYSKYHYDKSSSSFKEGLICDLALVDVNFDYPSTYVEIGRVIKNGVQKKVVVFVQTEQSFLDNSNTGISIYKKNTKQVFDLMRNSVVGIDGAKYIKASGDPLKKFEI